MVETGDSQTLVSLRHWHRGWVGLTDLHQQFAVISGYKLLHFERKCRVWHFLQWQCVLFLRWGSTIYFFNEHGLISITEYWMTVVCILFTQLNVSLIGLGYYMIRKFAIYLSWESLQLNVYSLGTQGERQIGVIKVRPWHIQYCLAHSCLHLADLGYNH